MRLKVLTLNVAHGAPFAVPLPFLRRRADLLGTLDGVAALLVREAADVVALQEADRSSLFSGRVDQVERIAARAGYPHVHHGVHSGVPGLFAQGTALLARGILEAREAAHFGRDRRVDKGYVVATLAAEDGPGPDVVSLHLDPFSHAVRLRQVDRLIHALRQRPERPRVVLGDFNAEDVEGQGPVARLCDALGLHAPQEGEPTYPVPHARQRLDWVLASTTLRFTRYTRLPEAVSDHHAVVAELTDADG
ncbi:endonuclease/exonuclease/phosphatase family protein [Corallococcus sp. BB11-1]|uniref:endonuclease/exonuclease/phosphatase family protein n=1 Tax=Corallococcus sp. BB11-1 TaxID=2996783 RepID=UPI00226D95B2|nr:endonuclease/exonuclease/phosphatase family protein [Corallococcus sp. BB11-1]MCY1030619.1 endonuclease/exonuclease/phosphatase family protein [Corallococcus sp. BB11-1]